MLSPRRIWEQQLILDRWSKLDGSVLEPLEQVRLHRALRLGLRTARQLMVPRERLAMVDAAMPFAEVVRVVAASPTAVFRFTGATRTTSWGYCIHAISRFDPCSPIHRRRIRYRESEFVQLLVKGRLSR